MVFNVYNVVYFMVIKTMIIFIFICFNMSYSTLINLTLLLITLTNSFSALGLGICSKRNRFLERVLFSGPDIIIIVSF